MSHFTVLVIGKEIDKQLQPYHEYECTGIEDQYVTFVGTDETEEELQEIFVKMKDKYNYKTFDDFMTNYYGYIQQNGKWGRLTNPNSKWDWWVIGGRWTGFFKLKPNGTGISGQPGLMTSPAKPGYADSALKKDIDFEYMRKSAEDRAIQQWDYIHEAIKGIPIEHERWETVIERLGFEEGRDFYHKQPLVKAFKGATQKENSPVSWWGYSIEDFLVPKEEYIESGRHSAITTYAVVMDSKWFEKGTMGWWGMSSDEMSQKEWNNVFNDLVDSLPDDTLLTIVDAHI
jgi:hypothetical protein